MRQALRKAWGGSPVKRLKRRMRLLGEHAVFAASASMENSFTGSARISSIARSTRSSPDAAAPHWDASRIANSRSVTPTRSLTDLCGVLLGSESYTSKIRWNAFRTASPPVNSLCGISCNALRSHLDSRIDIDRKGYSRLGMRTKSQYMRSPFGYALSRCGSFGRETNTHPGLNRYSLPSLSNTSSPRWQ